MRPPLGAVNSLPASPCLVGCRAMATEEKKPEAEAARAQPTPSSSATQSKARPCGLLGTKAGRPSGIVHARNCFPSPPHPPLKYCQFLLQTTFPASPVLMWAVSGIPNLSPGEGASPAVRILGLDRKSLCGTWEMPLVQHLAPGPHSSLRRAGVQTPPVDRRRASHQGRRPSGVRRGA